MHSPDAHDKPINASISRQALACGIDGERRQGQFAGCWFEIRQARREPQVFMSTNTDLDPTQIIAFFVRRWQIDVTLGEACAHLGVETQRQWNDNAIMRTTPSLLAL